MIPYIGLDRFGKGLNNYMPSSRSSMDSCVNSFGKRQVSSQNSWLCQYMSKLIHRIGRNISGQTQACDTVVITDVFNRKMIYLCVQSVCMLLLTREVLIKWETKADYYCKAIIRKLLINTLTRLCTCCINQLGLNILIFDVL